MAKRKTVAPPTSDAVPPSRDDLARGVASAMFAGMLVYVTYYPSDSVSIERGDGLWFSAIAIATSTILWAVSNRTSIPSSDRSGVSLRRWSIAIDGFAMLLAAWMMIAAFGIAGSGNLRQATNEAWLWVGAAAVLTASRRLFEDRFAKRAAMVLLVGCSVGLGVHALHQHFVSLPRTLAEYRADPDAVLRMAGIDAPPGSSIRMVFENRLLDGGPTGTFALANSLAGVLLVGFIVAGGVWLFHAWRSSKSAVVFGFVVVCLVMVALFFTHSRSGLLAAFVGAGIVVACMLMDRVRETDAGQRSRLAFKLAMTGGAGFLMLIASVMVFAVFGKDEWLDQAPSSLAFRFQYWRATWRLAMDRPLFGAGPGNFQAVYPSYREASAAESIAEPHNFFFETLASGGFVAVAILVALIVAITAFRYRFVRINLRENAQDESVGAEVKTTVVDQSSRWWCFGAASSFTLIWLLGLATGQAPDWDAQLLAVPAALVAMLMAWRVTSLDDEASESSASESNASESSGRRIDVIVLSAMASLMLHLVVSGGWTVPGVAVWLWVLVGMWVPVPRSGLQQVVPRQIQQRTRVVSIVAGMTLLVMLRLISLGPVEASASAMRAVLAAQSQRQTERAIRELERASAADPWSPESTLWLSDFYRWQLIQNRESDSVAQNWREAGELAIQRSGGDPSLIGLVAAQPLHLFQRWGRAEDLERAMELYDLACQKSPTHAAFFAQRAEIAERLGDAERANLDAKYATETSELGENLERRLFVELILVVEIAGEAANNGPILETASKLLKNQLDTSGVMGQTE